MNIFHPEVIFNLDLLAVFVLRDENVGFIKNIKSVKRDPTFSFEN